ncbi:serine--tRNA ligase, partial [Candidatus Woesearchaeota archaeon]|nr:serine--tRNA ligase [Candidatus Woesearchaeota archaeon]
RENPDLVKENLRKRNQEEKVIWVDTISSSDKRWRELKQKADRLRNQRNILTEEIRKAKEKKKDVNSIIKEAKEIPQKIEQIETEMEELRQMIDSFLMRLPNMIHESVPKGKTAEDNKPIKFFLPKPKKSSFELRNHVDLLEKSGLANFDAGRDNSGQGFNYLTGEMAELDLSLQRYGVDYLIDKGFKLVGTPLLLNKKTLQGAVNFDDFRDVIYKLEGEDLYLIATGEHSLVSLYKNCTFNKKDLPIKICTVTPCFRKEIGGHGVDSKGIFRMHQFNKVEQVVICSPEDSYKYLEEMQGITESFFKSLKIPFRVITICSGDLGPKMSKQYDIEAWFPREQKYKEVTSAGNTTDYQSNKLNIKYINTDGEKKSVHMLNNTMVATSRAMVAILENFQNKDGTITVPKPLVPYIYNKKKIGGFKK